MNEAGLWGKGAREGTGGWGSAGGRRQGRSPGGHGGIRAAEGVEKAVGGKRREGESLTFG